MTEEEKAVFNAAITLAKYCTREKDCSGCILSDADGCDCGVGPPWKFKVPAALCDKKE